MPPPSSLRLPGLTKTRMTQITGKTSYQNLSWLQGQLLLPRKPLTSLRNKDILNPPQPAVPPGRPLPQGTHRTRLSGTHPFAWLSACRQVETVLPKFKHREKEKSLVCRHHTGSQSTMCRRLRTSAYYVGRISVTYFLKWIKYTPKIWIGLP